MVFKIILSILFLIVLVSGAYVFGTGLLNIEERKYSILISDKNFEIRQYSGVHLISVELTGASYSETANSGFNLLASYIFGNNSSKEKIAMTAPVTMEFGKDKTKMCFMLPSEKNISDLPLPQNQEIIIGTDSAFVLATLRFGGYAGDKEIENQKEQLLLHLKKYGVIPNTNPIFLWYNSPFRVIARRNEVGFVLSESEFKKIKEKSANKLTFN